MSDDLVKRLRGMSPKLDMLQCEDVLQAADRIEALTAALEKADALAEQLDGTYIWMEKVHAAAKAYRAAREAVK